MNGLGQWLLLLGVAVCVIVIGIGSLRLGEQAAVARAQSGAAATETPAAEEPSPVGLAELLRQRASKLDEREQQLNDRERQLEAREQAVQRQLETLTQMKEEVQQAAGTRTKEEQENLAHLIEIYQKMRTENAARAVLDLYVGDEAFALSILRGLNVRDVAKIMDAIVGTDPAIAARISEQLARPTFLLTGGGAATATAPQTDTSGE